ncbi:hypothetical protein RND81_02G031400 [Saponaria officinalis]|uniref:Uncharacterized protein n=1 Tax=Saponaria officinalis TaxID=3572 RepID=A0AAW1MQG6_SAPOF
MAMATYSTYKGNGDGGVHLRDVSFSSYLDSTERDFVRNLAASIHNNNQSPAGWESSVTTPRLSRGKNRISRVELDVFGAERYFNEKLEDQKSQIPKRNHGVRSQHKSMREKTLDQLENKSTYSTTSTISHKSPTPSLKSQESYNSQSNGLKLLSNLQGVCSNKKSIYTIKNQNIVQSPKLSYKGDNKSRESNKISHYQDHFEFPIIHDEQPRKSLEVFGFKHIGKQDTIAQNIERKLSILAWDAIPNSKNNASFVKVDHYDQHDVRSEASSDLFEIENISGNHVSHQSSYATSEASIEWSVVTASAADQLSVASIRCENYQKVSNMVKMKVQKSSSSSLGGAMLLGCKSHKAIDVIVGSFNNRNNKKN